MSPEYGEAPDNNYNLSLLRWGCQTLLTLNERYHLNDPQIPEWNRVLTNLTAYPQDENGFMIGAGVPLAHSHRHWSHMLMVWPLHTLSCEQPENKEVLEKTLQHWLTVDNGKQVYGWSAAAAAHLYATMGDGENALKQLRSHHNNKQFVMPNTQYIEGSPVYECSLVAASSLQYMLLQSWGGPSASSRPCRRNGAPRTIKTCGRRARFWSARFARKAGRAGCGFKASRASRAR